MYVCMYMYQYLVHIGLLFKVKRILKTVKHYIFNYDYIYIYTYIYIYIYKFQDSKRGK